MDGHVVIAVDDRHRSASSAPRTRRAPEDRRRTVRAAEVNAASGPKPERQQAEPRRGRSETWIDEGPLRSEARKAAARAPDGSRGTASPSCGRRRRSRQRELAPEVADDCAVQRPPVAAARYEERLATAADALDRGRYDDARRMVQPVLRDLPDMAFASRDRRSGAVPHSASGARPQRSWRSPASSTAR